MGRGGSFERKEAVVLSLWVSGGTKRDLFQRTAISGGRATAAFKRGKQIRQSGDLTAVAPEGHIFTDNYFLELKDYKKKNAPLTPFLFKNKGILAKFWAKCKRQAKQYKRYPIMIVRLRGLQLTLVITRDPFNPRLRSYVADCYITTLDDFLKMSFSNFAWITCELEVTDNPITDKKIARVIKRVKKSPTESKK